MKIVNKKRFFLVSSAITLFIFVLLILYLLMNKYNDCEILSIKNEYNLAFLNSDETINIPLYFERNNTFLVDEKSIVSTFIYNDEIKVLTGLKEIEKGNKISYDSSYYYEYIFSFNPKSIEETSDPLYISDAKVNIAYLNGESISLSIGNLSLYFDYSNSENNDLIITKLSSLSEEIDSSEIMLGVNIEIYNNNEESITIKSIKIRNKNYELLNSLKCENEIQSYEDFLKNYNDYLLVGSTISDNEINYIINAKEKKQFFIPIKYINGLRIVDRFPLFISYYKEELVKIHVMDDFLFFKVNNKFSSKFGIEKYVYRYY